MAQLNPGSMGGDVVPRHDDLYTVLIVVAAGFVWVAAIYAMIRAVSLFGSLLPPAGG